MPRSLSWFLLLVGVVGLLLARESRHPASALAGIDRAFFDWLGANTIARPVPGTPTVTLVEIDDGVAETPNRLPLPALEYASFLHSVLKYEPAVIAVVPTLDWARSPPGTEQILLDEALGVPRLLLGVRLGSSEGHGRDPAALPPVEGVRGNHTAFTTFPEIVEAPGARLLALATATGATNLPAAETGVPMRDAPLFFRSRDRVVPAFTLGILTLSLRLANSEVSVVPGSHVQLGDRLRLPIDADGRTLLDARAFSRINRLSLDDLPLLVVGQASPEARTAAGRMRGGVVILGRTDHASRTLRRPGGLAISAAEAFAWAAASLEQTPATHRASAWWDGGVVVVFAAWGVFLSGRSRRRATGLAAAALAGYALVALAIFESARLWLPCALPLGLTLLLVTLIWLPAGPVLAPAQKT